MSSLPPCIILRPVVLQVFCPGARRHGWAAEWSPHNLGGNDQHPAAPLGHTGVYGVRRDPPKGSEEDDQVAHRPTFHHLPAVLTHQGSPTWLEVSKCHAHLQEGPEGGSGELQPSQLDLGAKAGRGADLLRAIMWRVQDNQGIRTSQPEFMKGGCCAAWPTRCPAMKRGSAWWLRERLRMLFS